MIGLCAQNQKAGGTAAANGYVIEKNDRPYIRARHDGTSRNI